MKLKFISESWGCFTKDKEYQLVPLYLVLKEWKDIDPIDLEEIIEEGQPVFAVLADNNRIMGISEQYFNDKFKIVT